MSRTWWSTRTPRDDTAIWEHAVTAIDEMHEIIDKVQTQVGSIDRWSVYAAELIGILYAINKAIRRQWIHGHCETSGNSIAGRLAKEAVIPSKIHSFSYSTAEAVPLTYANATTGS